MCRGISWVVGKGYMLRPPCSFDKTLLAFALIHFVLQDQTCLLFWLSLDFLGFPSGSDGKKFACNTGDPGSIPGLGSSPGEGNGNPLQCSCLGNPMDGGAWRATVHGVTKSQT